MKNTMSIHETMLVNTCMYIKGNLRKQNCWNLQVNLDCSQPPGAIIRDGDRKRAPFLVLGLAP